jgi:imidazole glycerol-phosphate synthase subunit HisH
VTAPSVVLLDYGSGNVHSAAKALELAGVGAFSVVARALAAARGGELVDRRLSGGRPVLGICVGMQVMFESGVERGNSTPGLGEWPGVVEQLDAPVLPHIGWNTVDAPADSALFAGLDGERFYFVHSFAATDWSLRVDPPFPEPRLAWAEHGQRFLAAVENGPLAATQFHPEKSGRAGLRLLSNWIDSL